MHALKLATVTAVVVFALPLLTACGGSPPPAAAKPSAGPAAADDMPKWVRMGCGAFFGEKKKVVCGVGAASGMGDNIALARTAAQGRGRTEIARSMRVRVKSILKDYQNTTASGKRAVSEQLVEDTSKQVTDLTLAGTVLQDSWVSKDGTFYALMVLDVEAFKSSLNEMRQLDEQIRAAIVQRAEKAFAELDAEVEGKKAE
ncbi:MAG TPA: LPP20 family lipoprotein [Polyangia bacterium]|jgi:hypothetical protein